MRRAPVLCALAVALFGVAPVSAADTGSDFGDFVQRIDVEVGVESGTLIVMPILLRGDAAAGSLGPEAGKTVRWEPADVAGNTETVRLVGGAVDGAGLPTFVPPGTLLVGGARERLLTRPVAVTPGAPWLVHSIVCDSRTKEAEPAPQRPLGKIAPLQQRKLDLLRSAPGTFAILQRVQALSAGLGPEQATVSEVLSSPFVTQAVSLRKKELRRIPPAFGGRAVGHVVFFGYRAVEAVVFGDPAAYRVHGPALLDATAASHALWEAALGIGGRGAPGTDLREMKAHAQAVLDALARAQPRKWQSRRGETGAWRTYSAATRKRATKGTSVPLLCRIVEDESGAFLFAEAIENASEEAVYPLPYPEPGGEGEGDGKKDSGTPRTADELERIFQVLRRNLR